MRVLPPSGCPNRITIDRFTVDRPTAEPGVPRQSGQGNRWGIADCRQQFSFWPDDVAQPSWPGL